MINQDEIYPSCYGEVSLTFRLSVTVEIHDHAIKELIRVLMSFIISVCLFIGKAIKLDKVTILLDYVRSPT